MAWKNTSSFSTWTRVIAPGKRFDPFQAGSVVTGAVLLALLLIAPVAPAQSLMSPKELEEAQIREALERVIANDPSQAPIARKALDALDEPETTARGRQVRTRRENGQRRIVNGIATAGYPAVGALLKGNDRRTARLQCTGTLVGCDKFLTAAHCIVKDPSPASYLVFLEQTGFSTVKDIAWEPTKYKYPYPKFDLAMLTLEKPVEGIAPMAINLSLEAPLDKSTATIVGFGRTGGATADFGIKREGGVKTAACPDAYADWNVFCWPFDAEVRLNRSKSNTCNGDSGGGVFMRDRVRFQVVEKVFGVVSGGREFSDCVRDDLSINVNVYKYPDWFKAAGEGRLSSQMCGADGKDLRSKQVVLHLDSKTPERSDTIEVPKGTGSLRVAMNAEDDGKGTNDFDLLLFKGRTSSETSQCTEDGSGQFGFCEINAPEPGQWTIVVTQKTGEGSAQITATLVPANRH